MSTPRKDERAAEMYARYQTGLSLAQVAQEYGVTRQSVYGLFAARGYELRSQHRFGPENHFYRGGVRADGHAHDLTEKAIKRGDLVRADVCETCGGDGRAFRDGRHPIQAHHCDYNRPLDVMWLCQPCHHEWHRNNVPVEVAS